MALIHKLDKELIFLGYVPLLHLQSPVFAINLEPSIGWGLTEYAFLVQQYHIWIDCIESSKEVVHVDASRCASPSCVPDAFQLYARNDPKQVPRRNVHIISRPDGSKGAGYDFIRAAPS